MLKKRADQYKIPQSPYESAPPRDNHFLSPVERKNTTVDSSTDEVRLTSFKKKPEPDHSRLAKDDVEIQMAETTTIGHEYSIDQSGDGPWRGGTMEYDSDFVLPLPAGWEQDITDDGIPFYLNHNDMSTHWCHPLERDPDLAPGWENVNGPFGVYYMNHNTGIATYERPKRNSRSMSAITSEEQLANSMVEHSKILRQAAKRSTGSSHFDQGPHRRQYNEYVDSDPPA